MFASLVSEDGEEEADEAAECKNALVAGTVVSSLFHLRDESCFVFPDLSIRTEGRWRFKMSLYELTEDGVRFCSSVLTDVFQVYSSKRFPGMSKSTELSKSFAQQGIKLRVRRPGSRCVEFVLHFYSSEPDLSGHPDSTTPHRKNRQSDLDGNRLSSPKPPHVASQLRWPLPHLDAHPHPPRPPQRTKRCSTRPLGSDHGVRSTRRMTRAWFGQLRRLRIRMACTARRNDGDMSRRTRTRDESIRNRSTRTTTAHMVRLRLLTLIQAS
ncbi:velvet factor-domain-containing protein [Rhodotorula toruloides]